jgi:hypothetical protein
MNHYQPTRPMTSDEVIATNGIEARCFYKRALWPRVSVGVAGVLQVAALVAARTKRIRQ